MNSHKRLGRRTFITTAGLGILGAATAQRLGLPAERPNRQRVLRIAHLTDIHVQPELGAGEGMAVAIEHAHNLKDRPDIILQGGDAIMDALAEDKTRTKTQWGLFHKTFAETATLPVRHVIGNHDVWGWSLENPSKADIAYGKDWAKDEFGLREGYYSYDQAGWHFVVLDSVSYAQGGYTARLGDAQLEWLDGDLAAVPRNTPVCVVSHIPILSACTYLDGDNETSGNWQVPGAWMHIDARKIKDVFSKYNNVRLALSGHVHLQDEVHYLGVKYLCNGAVSGGWWGGPYQEFTNAYFTVDLYDDGSSESQVHTFGWQARSA